MNPEIKRFIQRSSLALLTLGGSVNCIPFSNPEAGKTCINYVGTYRTIDRSEEFEGKTRKCFDGGQEPQDSACEREIQIGLAVGRGGGGARLGHLIEGTCRIG